MTYGEWYHKWKNSIDVLSVYDKNGEEIDDDEEIPEDVKVIDFTRDSGWFDVMLDYERR